MKKLFFILLGVITLCNVSFASFPVNDVQIVELSVEEDSSDNSIWTQMTVKPYKFHLGGFIAGFFLGLTGVGLVYLLNKDPDARRSAWYGLGVIFVLFLILISWLVYNFSNNDGNSYYYY
tara:strand:- start:12 stop:371 length:360 start_codon:yes stop_codon:yes gene_type:complete